MRNGIDGAEKTTLALRRP